jgi:iron complex outermembrane recepter protein
MGRMARAGLFAAASTAALGLAAAAQAQEASPQEPDTVVDELVVTGLRGSLKDALQVKRASDLVVEAISADSIGQLPDVTIAETLVRLPGINGTRDRGNSSQAAIRGLGPRLVLGLINGREVASSEPDRNVRWEIYPSEVVSGVEVYKSQSADLVSGGIAGTVNIKTLTPLTYTGPSLTVRGGPVYYDGGGDIPDYDPWGFRGSAALVHKPSDTFAFTLGAAYQEQKNAYPSFQGWGYNDLATGGNPGDINGDGRVDPTPWGAQTEVKQLKEDRFAVMGGFQWQASDNFELRFDALYSKVKIDEKQNQAWYGRNGVWGNWGGGNNGAYNAPGSSYEFDSNGNVVSATLPYVSVTNVIANYTEDKDLFITGLNGAWTEGPWRVSGDLSYSRAQRENIWQAVKTEVYPAWMTFDTRAGRRPTVTTSSDPSDPTQQFVPNWLSGGSDGPENLDDELFAGQFDVVRTLDGAVSSLAFGARASTRTKNHSRRQGFPSSPGVQLPAGSLRSFEVSAFEVPPILDGDFDELFALAYPGFDPRNNPELLADRWEVREDVQEAYVKANFRSDLGSVPLTGNIGVRVLNVQTTSEGFESVNGGALNPVSVDHDYTEVLPSLNMTFDLSDGKLIRLGLARTVARPPLDELRAGRSLFNTTPPPTGSAGNPLLDPFKASQIDLSFEWYFAPEALFAISTYFKDVDSHIGYSTQPVSIGGITYNITGPFNGDGGTIKGFEATFQTPFSFVPMLEHFGVYANYAYVDSDIREFYPANNPLDAAGFAKHTATIDLWYNNGPLEVRVGYKYHSPFTVIYGWSGADVRTLEAESIFDFSTSYTFNDHLSFRFQVNNITNEPLRIYRDNDPDRLGRYDVYGRRFLVDVTYKF